MVHRASLIPLEDTAAMIAVHAGQGAGEDFGSRFVECFLKAADDADLPVDSDLRSGLSAYMKWAVDDVLSYSPRDSIVEEGLQVPRWGWNGLERGSRSP